MKRKVSRWSILLIVFAVALTGFDIYFNRDSASMTASMEPPSLPMISFQVESHSVNPLAGNVEEMDFSAARNTVVPLSEEGELRIKLHTYDNQISSLIYTAYTGDGAEKLLTKTEKKPKKELTLSFGDLYADGQSGYLRVTLVLEDDSRVFYDTRIARDSKAQLASCIEYAKELHESMLHNTDTDKVERVLETRTQGAASSLQHVTIYSPLEHATWGELKPELVGEVTCEIQEMKEAYTSLQLRYQVRCADESICKVEEFFKVRFAGEKFYLLAYDRVIEEVFEGNSKALISKGIRLGLASQDLQYQANEAGTVVAFVQAGELWSYNQKEREFACVFRFTDAEKADLRNETALHRVQILSMDKKGNLTFAVYGYMNRGDHEGESGATIYYYDVSRNMIKETAFIPSQEAYAVIAKEYGELAYYNEEADVLYVMVGSALYKVELQTGEQSLLLQASEQGGLVSAADGHLIAYQHPQKETEAIVLDFATGKERKVQVEEGECIQPLGFVMGDFVYGVARKSD
ncbi:MAG: hypothetical protein UHS49_01855, partial [Faecalimonas sp.]|nr:hypothetical protein [Faecalimonas sp.]